MNMKESEYFLRGFLNEEIELPKRNTENCVYDLFRNKKIIAYGAGNGFVTFFVFILRKYNFILSLVIDAKFRTGDHHMGFPACSLHDWSPSEEEKNKSIIVITVGDQNVQSGIRRELEALGCKHIIVAMDIYEYHLSHAPAGFDSVSDSYYICQRDKIVSCLDILEDQESRDVYCHFLKIFMTKTPLKIPNRPIVEQYFPSNNDTGLELRYDRVIHCGAYDGDTVRQLGAIVGKIGWLACFEPDNENFKKLCESINSNKTISDQIILIPCGVYDKTTQVKFHGGNAVNSSISQDGGNMIIQCVTLDDALPLSNPTLITMDIEGVELEALVGAEQIIRNNHPDLAICVYHEPRHIWEIPLYLRKLNPNYKIRLRNYTSFPAETVCYATK